MQLLSIYDMVSQRYMKPFWAQNVGSAVRSFGDMCGEADSVLAAHPEDYALYHIASFDDSTGKLTERVPEKVASASSYVALGQIGIHEAIAEVTQ